MSELLDRLVDKVNALEDERDDLRALVAEILDAASPDDGAEGRIAEWRQRAGLEPQS